MPFTTAHAFDAASGEYRGETRAFADPLDPGHYLLPAGATLAPPPPPGPNQAAVFTNGAWGLVPDHRGQTFYLPDGGVALPLDLGAAPDPGWSTSPPPPTLAESQAAKVAAVDALLLEKVAAGFTYAALSATFQMGPDKYGRWAVDNVTAIAAGIVTFQGVPAEIGSTGYWDMANTPHPMTATAFITFATAMRDYFSALLARGRALKNQALAAATQATLDGIDINTGWPG